MAADGSIVIDVDLDNKKAQQELNKLNKKIESLNDQIYIKQQQQMPLIEQSRQLGAELDAAKAKLEGMRSGGEFFTSSSINQQAEKVKQLQKEWDAVQKKVESYDASIEKTNIALNLTKERAGDIQKQLASSGPNTEIMSQAMDRMQKSAGKFSMRLREVVRSALIFTAISQGLASLREWFGKVIKTNDEATAAIGRLKGALLTLVQPLVNVIIPAFTTFVNVLARIVSAVAKIVSALFGTTAEQSAEAAENLYNEANAIESVGSAAEKATGSLAGFDEINQLSDSSSSGSGGGTGSLDTISPDFRGAISDQLLGIVELFTGAALLALGAILTFTGVHVLLGIGLMVLGALAIWDAATSNPGLAAALVERGLDTILEIVGAFIAVIGVILVVTGHFLVGIGMILAGISIFSVGAAAGDEGNFAENIKLRLLEAAKVIGPLIAVLGVVLICMGQLLQGVSLIIAGIALFEVASVEDDNGMTLQQKIVTVLSSIAVEVGKMLAIIGVVFLCIGKIALGIGFLIAGISLFAVGETALNWDLLKTDIILALSNILHEIGRFLFVIGVIMMFVPGMQGVGIGMMLAGIGAVAFSEIAPNWNFILDKFKEVWANIKNWWKTNVAQYFTLDFWKGLGQDILNGLLDGLKSIWTSVSSWVSEKVGWITGQFSGTKKKVSAEYSVNYRAATRDISLPRGSVPALAAGAVIPPNREFLAVLGDQRSGTNIEAPLDTIQQALVQAMREIGITSGGTQTINLVVDGRTLAKVIVPQINRMTQQAGKPVLNF